MPVFPSQDFSRVFQRKTLFRTVVSLITPVIFITNWELQQVVYTRLNHGFLHTIRISRSFKAKKIDRFRGFFIFTDLKKVLVIRFSAIGDVVLTSPVLRCIKKQYPNCEIHFVVKDKFREAVELNPNVDRLHTIKEHPAEALVSLKSENFDFVADLQRNRKSAWLRKKLKRPSGTFPKLNVRKFLLTTFKINAMPQVHVVDRYFNAVKKINVVNDEQGLEFFTEPEDKTFGGKIPQIFSTSYVALVLGATYYTKRIPQAKLEEILDHVKIPVVLLGGSAEKELADLLEKKYPNIINPVGQTNLFQSALYIKYAQYVITSDTGLMHIAAAYQKKIVTVWGNTVPDFGMGPYMPQQPHNAVSFEVKVSCRPCSKLGYDKCPKGHFKCMLDQDAKGIASLVEKGF